MLLVAVEPFLHSVVRMLAKTLNLLEGLLSLPLALPLALLEYLRKWLHFRRLANRFPGPRPWPLAGNLFKFGLPLTVARVFTLTVTEVVHKYRTGQFWIGPFRTIFLNDPNDIKRYLQNIKNQSKDPLFYKMIAEVIGNGLITRSGEQWRQHNKMLAPTFHVDILNSYVSVFDKKTDIFVQLLREHADGSAFDMRRITEHLTADITLETILGVPSDMQREPEDVFHSLDEIADSCSYRLVRPWLYSFFYSYTANGRKFAQLSRLLRNYLRQKVIHVRERLLDEDGLESPSSSGAPSGRKPRLGFLDAMIVEMQKGRISYEEVLDEVETFLLAGFDTTFLTVLFSLYHLAKNPHIQERVVRELQMLFRETETTKVTVDKLQQMEYLEMVIKETLRVNPPIWAFVRVTGEDTPLATGDFVVPAGCRVIIFPLGVHTDPQVHPQPHIFDPERFSKENASKMHPFAFLPFSAGQRACLGRRFSMMEMKTILSKVLLNYKVLPEPSYEPNFRWAISAVPSNGVWLKLVRRQ